MTTAAVDTRLVCPECRHENEPERIYCHQCGVRLDRSAVRFKKEPIQDTQKRVKRMFDPSRAKMKAFAQEFIKLVWGAGLVALVLVMILAPELPQPSKTVALVSSIRFELETMANKHTPPTKEFTEEQANSYLTSIVKQKQSVLDKPFLPYKRAVVAFHDRTCVLTVERSVGGFWSVYTTCSYVPELKDGKLSATIIAGKVGRLPIHPKIAAYMGILQGDLKRPLDADLKLLSHLSAIQLHDKKVDLIAATRGAP